VPLAEALLEDLTLYWATQLQWRAFGIRPGLVKCPHSRRTQVAARAQSRTGSAHLKCPTIERKPGNNHRPDDWADYKQFMYWQGWAVSVAYIHECPLEILGNNQLDALVHLFIYFMSLHVSSVRALIIRRSNCINT